MKNLGIIAPLTVAIALLMGVPNQQASQQNILSEGILSGNAARAETPEELEELQVQNPVDRLLSTGQCRGCDLSGVDLSEAHLIGADLRDANLEGAMLVRTNLEGADLTGANLTDADLTEAMLSDSILDRTILNRVNLTNATLYNITAAGAEMSELILTGAEILDTTPGIGGDREQFDENAIEMDAN
ncbi:pentapeptide repeat-containing protein [Spirulina sp. 06S082]|uniref:pentapeptide repeat-containing protein n=1 Tax=Spirulina sp. 06S082 TaxID=3110248 RepID=UPI002B20FEA1|nr:pentapeptide repeat-containing protein [Spirulina sp. 06S082]MEA5472019.1 pentapeptide repeat-containing protein [Spirulina sp. 06S082]